MALAVLLDVHLLALQPSSKRSLQAETLPDRGFLARAPKFLVWMCVYKGKIVL